MEMTKMDKIWIATATLIKPNTNKTCLVTLKQIIDQVWTLWQTTITPIMVEKHLVSHVDRQADTNNPSRGGSRNRYLFRTIDGEHPSDSGQFRLYMKSDEKYDGWDKDGPICPNKNKIELKYHTLIDWYLEKYYPQ